MSELVPVGHGPQAQVHSELEPEVHKMELELEPVTTKLKEQHKLTSCCWCYYW